MKRYGRAEFEINHGKGVFGSEIGSWFGCIDDHRGLDGFNRGVWNYHGQSISVLCFIQI
jgi:hypothetical protein